jgi:hypothetical protein
MSVVTIERFAAFYNQGIRGELGGAAQNDKVWGIAVVDNRRCTFWGRRNAKLRFKSMPGAIGKQTAETLYQYKIDKPNGNSYTPITTLNVRDILVPNLEGQIISFFYSDLGAGKINTRMRPVNHKVA